MHHHLTSSSPFLLHLAQGGRTVTHFRIFDTNTVVSSWFISIIIIIITIIIIVIYVIFMMITIDFSPLLIAVHVIPNRWRKGADQPLPNSSVQ